MRSGFEAADSGILIWRERPLLLLLSYAIPAALIVVIAYNITLPFYRTVTYFNIQTMRYLFSAAALCWCKPLFDRFALLLISKLFFNKNISVKEIALSFFPAVFRGLIGDLTWRRFNPHRNAVLPLRILEKQKRKMLRARKETLINGGLGFTVFLTILSVVLEIALFICSMIFAFAIVILLDLNINLEQSVLYMYLVPLILAVFFINFCIVETLGTAMSFAVYINSRVITEGWDLEIIFSSLALGKKQNEQNE